MNQDRDIEAIRKRIVAELGRKIQLSSITALLDEIEGWGNQHLVLFESTENHAKAWKKPAKINEVANSLGLKELVNGTRPMLLPEKPTLSQVISNPKRIRFVWIQRRTWHVRREDLDKRTRKATDKHTNEIEYRAYEVQQRRGICYFDWNLVTCQAALLMQVLPNQSGYEELQRQLFSDLGNWMARDAFDVVGLQSLISKLEASQLVSRRNLLLATTNQTEVNIKSSDKRTDAYADKAIVDMRVVMQKSGPVASRRGFFYWQPVDGELERPIAMRVYPKNNRISIDGQCTEDEIQYVLSRVRDTCQ